MWVSDDREGRRERSDGFAGLLKETLEGFSHLVAEHSKLARLELRSDLKAMGQRLGVAMAMVVPALLGYVFINVALAIGLSFLLGAFWGWLIIGLLNAIGAGGAALASLRAARREEIAPRSRQQLAKSVEEVRSAGRTDDGHRLLTGGGETHAH